jgi:hypothetical protein
MMSGKSLLVGLLSVLPMFGSSLLSGLSGGPVYWYNGDLDAFAASTNGDGIFPNEVGGGDGSASTWDDFTVGPSGAVITGLFSFDELRGGSPTVFQDANWQILNGAPGASGTTVVASGSGASAVTTDTQQAIGGIGDPYAGELYLTEVTGLNIDLAGGTYWLSLAPDVSEGAFYNVTTAGANGVGTPQAQDGNSYFSCVACAGNPVDAPAIDYVSNPSVGDTADGGHIDFSMGVEGVQASPEPGTLALAGLGLLLAGIAKRRRAA